MLKIVSETGHINVKYKYKSRNSNHTDRSQPSCEPV